ncbi:MAG TPA: hypothetical protein PK776_03485 [Flavobacterium sp.]|jgi:hypothetical protein|nr:hypothetical protein [Flavobacterium sp.]
MRIKILLLFLVTSCFSSAQNAINSSTRKFIDNAAVTRIVKDWNVVANIKSGTGETVSFFPIEITDLKTGQIVKALQMDMSVDCQNFKLYKSSWVDLDEISEFVIFLENYVIPKLSKKTEKNKSITYVFKSKEITVRFMIGDFTNRLSIYPKDEKGVDGQCYFWTETQIDKSQELLTVLQTLKQ